MCRFRHRRSDCRPQWNGEGKGMCGFRHRRSDRRPQWGHGRGAQGEVRISPEAFGPQAAVGPGGS